MTNTSETRSRIILTLTICLIFGLNGVAEAAKGGNGGGKGGGGGGGHDGGGGGGETPIEVTFADEMGASGYRISGDGLGPYVHDGDGSGDGTQAYLGSGGAYGDIFVRLGNAPSRGFWFDFSDCHPDPESCTPPFSMGIDLESSLAVAPGDVVKDGLFGMALGQTISAPMEFTYAFDSPEGPGNVHFAGDHVKGRNPCKNKSLQATVTRHATDRWTVSADLSILACATLPGGSLSGQYLMPFAFTVELLP